MIACEGLHPLLVVGGALARDFLADSADPVQIGEEVYDVLRPGEQRHMAQDDDAVETVVYKCQQATKQPHEIFRRSCGSLAFCVATRTSEGDRWRSKKFKFFCLDLVLCPVNNLFNLPRKFGTMPPDGQT